MLLINIKICRIDECEKVEEEVSRSYVMIVSRDKREREIDCFDREIIFAHDIDFFDVVNDIISDVIDFEEAVDSIKVDESRELEVDEKNEIVIVIVTKDDDIDNIDVENVDESETSEVNEVINV